MTKLDDYHNYTQNITFDKIDVITHSEAIRNMFEYKTDYAYYKYWLPKNIKFNISSIRGQVDIFFGIYSENNCEFKIHTSNIGLFQEGNIIKDKIRFINCIPVISLPFEDEISVELTSDGYLLFSILHSELRKFFTVNNIIIDKFICMCGKMHKDDINISKLTLFESLLQPKYYKLPYYDNYSIKDKLDSINKTEDYKEKYDLKLNENDKEKIMKNFDLLDYYITQKIKI